MIYQATLRRELARYGFEWEHVGESSGMAELAGVTKDTIKAWSKRSTRLRQWAAENLRIINDSPTARQLASAQRATRPDKPESLSWETLKEQWRADPRGFELDRKAWQKAHAERIKEDRHGIDRQALAATAAKISKAKFTRADMVELMAAHWPIIGDGDVLEEVQKAVAQVALRIGPRRESHNREGNEKFTIDLVIAEEHAILDMVDRADARSTIRLNESELDGLGRDQAVAVAEIGRSPQLIQVLQAPAGAGKTHSLKALRQGAHRYGKDVFVIAPTGKAVDTAINDEAGDHGHTVAKTLDMLADRRLTLSHKDLVLIDEASMVGTPDLHKLMSAITDAGAKMVLVGDEYQLSPVLARGGMFAQLTADLPWTQKLDTVWRLRNEEEKVASLAVRNGENDELKVATKWYRDQGRLFVGDPVAMAEDVYGNYLADRREGLDALIICDTWEMTDSLNQRLHRALAGENLSVPVARDHRVSVGDVIMTRDNDSSIPVALPNGQRGDQVRNGNRWTVVGIDVERQELHAVRAVANNKDADRARATFTREYAEKHITLGYASTVHSAQGVTADTCHSLMGVRASRTLAYVAMTRGRHSNRAYMYERFRGELDHEHTSPTGTDEIHIMRRGSRKHAAAAFYTLMVTNDDRPTTMLAEAAKTEPEHLPARVVSLLREHAHRKTEREQRYAAWRQEHGPALRRDRGRGIDTSRQRGHDIEHDDGGLEL